MRVFHWQTQHKVGSFAQHSAFGTAYEDLDGHIDDFIEKKEVLNEPAAARQIKERLKTDLINFVFFSNCYC
jgi:DNA-binding ferritin-like protein